MTKVLIPGHGEVCTDRGASVKVLIHDVRCTEATAARRRLRALSPKQCRSEARSANRPAVAS